MRAPQVVICSPDDWLANQLAELVHERKWLLEQLRRPAPIPSLVQTTRPLVLVLQLDVSEINDTALSVISDVAQMNALASVICVVDVKRQEPERAAWTAALMDLGARLVLFPPLTKAVLEDAVGGLLEAAIKRMAPTIRPEPVVDLATEGTAE